MLGILSPIFLHNTLFCRFAHFDIFWKHFKINKNSTQALCMLHTTLSLNCIGDRISPPQKARLPILCIYSESAATPILDLGSWIIFTIPIPCTTNQSKAHLKSMDAILKTGPVRVGGRVYTQFFWHR